MNVRLNNITINCMLAALLSALFASCKDDNEDEAVVDRRNPNSNVISFSTYTAGATRAVDVTSDVLKGKVGGRKGGFYVSAWYDNKPFFKDSCFFENGLAVDNSNIITNTFDTESDTYYWPYEVTSSKKVAFRAFNNLKKVRDGNPIWYGDNKDMIKYSPYWTGSEQEDLVVAYSEAEERPANGVQPLNFIHALSKINFSFTGADDNKYTVNRVEVIAAGKGSPTMSFNTTTDNTNPNTQAGMVRWTFTKIEEVSQSNPIVKKVEGDDKGARQGIVYTYYKVAPDDKGVDKNRGVVVNGTETVSMEDNLMLLPQDGFIAIRVYYKVEDPNTGELIGNCGYYRTDTKGNHDVLMKDGKVDNGGDNYFDDKDDKDPGVWGGKTLIVNLGSDKDDDSAPIPAWEAGKSYRFTLTLPTDNFKGDISGDGVADDLYEGKDLDGDGDGEESEFGMKTKKYIEFSVSVKAWDVKDVDANIVIK